MIRPGTNQNDNTAETLFETTGNTWLVALPGGSTGLVNRSCKASDVQSQCLVESREAICKCFTATSCGSESVLWYQILQFRSAVSAIAVRQAGTALACHSETDRVPACDPAVRPNTAPAVRPLPPG